jgi:hypothetical protein
MGDVVEASGFRRAVLVGAPGFDLVGREEPCGRQLVIADEILVAEVGPALERDDPKAGGRQLPDR